MKLSKIEIIEKAKNIISENKLINFTDLIDYGISNYSIYQKHKLHKIVELSTLLETNQKNQKINLKEQKQPEIKKLIELSLQICKKNNLVFRIDFLCNHLHISKNKFYDYGLNEVQEIRTALDNNRIALKQKKYSQIIKSDNPTNNAMGIRLLGTTEEIQRISTNYTDITTDGEKIRLNQIEKISFIK